MPPRRNRRPTPSPHSSPDRPAFLSSIVTPTAGPTVQSEPGPFVPPMATPLVEITDSDDPDLLDRSNRSRSRSRSQSGSRGFVLVGEPAPPEGRNAARRTPKEFITDQREAGSNASSEASKESERREATSENPAAEILRLRAELEAANAKLANFPNLEQIHQSPSARTPKELGLEISSMTDEQHQQMLQPSQLDLLGRRDPTQIIVIPEKEPADNRSDAEVSSVINERVFIVDTEDNHEERVPTPRAPTPHATTPREQKNKTPEAPARPEHTTRKPPQRQSAADPTPPSETEPPAGGSAKKRGSTEKQTPTLGLLPSYRGEAAVHKPGQKICKAPSGKVVEELKRAGANVPFDVPRPTVGSNVRGTPTHDDNVSALLKFWPHHDAVAALAQTMMEGEGEDLSRAHDFLMQQRDERIAAAVRRERDEGPGKGSKDDDAEEEAIREGGELAAFIAGAPDAITVVLHLIKVHKIQRDAHNAAPESTAANLIAHPAVQRFHDLKTVSGKQLLTIARAVIYDCYACELQRVAEVARSVDNRRKQEEAETRRLREEEAKEAEAERKRRAAEDARRREEREAERQRQARTPPLQELDDNGHHLSDAAFKDSDAKWAKKKKAQDCITCGKGNLGGDQTHLYVCDVCDKCYHKRCTLWVKVIRRNADPRSDDYSFAYI
jgi:hypothetical protein